MKMKRMLALVLALVLAVSALPMSAMAIPIYRDYFESYDAKFKDYQDFDELGSVSIGDAAVTIKAKDYSPSHWVSSDGKLYDFVGMGVANENTESPIHNNVSSITIPKDDGSTSWAEKYLDMWVSLAYAPHEHALSRWYYSNTNHWKECLVCKKYDEFHEPYLYNNWHYDGDGDDKCDVCEGAIVWYDITVEDVEGAKMVEVEGDKDMKARYNDNIVVEMEAEEGYILESIRFYKVREDGTTAEITRYIETPGEVYRFVMPNFDVKIVPIVYPAA